MTKIAADIAKSIREALVHTITSSPDAKIADLLALASGENAPMLRAITLGELVDSAANSRGPRSRVRKAKTPKPSTTATNAPKAPNTRTAEGRAAYDKAIIAALAKCEGPTSANALKEAVGGSSLQVRTSLNRLIEKGSVTYTGKARGTKYSLTG